MLEFFIGLLCGIALGFWASKDDSPKVEAAKAKMQEAFNHAGKLAKIIHKQRLVIRNLKTQLPKKPSLSAANQGRLVT